MIGYTRATRTEQLLQEVRFMSRNLLILLAPRPGLEPGTYGLTVDFKMHLYQGLGNIKFPLFVPLFVSFTQFRSIFTFFVYFVGITSLPRRL